jgi:small subunit ribosomal protein S6
MISHKGPHRMPLYENVFIARQDISGAQVDALADTFTQLVADNGGEVKKREYWGLRNLAYRMRKNRKGHYLLFNIEAPPAALAELERTMRINEDVIRYLTLRVDALEEGPSVVMQNRGGRDDRQRRGDRERFGEGRETGPERPAVDRPPVDRPPVDRPPSDAPIADTPVADTPVADTPVADTPVADTPAAETVEA